jgi:adenosylcobyric acid synthase
VVAVAGGSLVPRLRLKKSLAGAVAGLGLLSIETRFAAAKTLRRSSGYAGPVRVAGYEIHHGVVEVCGGRSWFTSEPADDEAALDGCRSGALSGTLWHGIFENDEFRRAYLAETARAAERDFVPAAGTCFAAARQAQFDVLADAIADNLNVSELLRLIEYGPAHELPTLRSGL